MLGRNKNKQPFTPISALSKKSECVHCVRAAVNQHGSSVTWANIHIYVQQSSRKNQCARVRGAARRLRRQLLTEDKSSPPINLALSCERARSVFRYVRKAPRVKITPLVCPSCPLQRKRSLYFHREIISPFYFYFFQKTTNVSSACHDLAYFEGK